MRAWSDRPAGVFHFRAFVGWSTNVDAACLHAYSMRRRAMGQLTSEVAVFKPLGGLGCEYVKMARRRATSSNTVCGNKVPS